MNTLNNEMFHPKVDEAFQNFYKVLDGIGIKNLGELSNLLGMLKSNLQLDNLINDKVKNQFDLVIGVLNSIEPNIQKFSVEHFCVGETLYEVLNNFVKIKLLQDGELPLYEISYFLGGKKIEVKKHVYNNYINSIGWEMFGYLFKDEYKSSTIVTNEILKVIILSLFKYEDIVENEKNFFIKTYFKNKMYSVMCKSTKEHFKSMEMFGLKEDSYFSALLHEFLTIDVTNKKEETIKPFNK